MAVQQQRKKNANASHADVTLPAVLNTAAFREAWAMFERHRKAIRKPLTPDAVALNLRKCEPWGEARAVAAIKHSIERGWTGIFEASGSGAPPASRPGEDDGTWKPQDLKPGTLAEVMRDGEDE